MRRIQPVLTLLLPLAAACQSIASTDVKTAGIYAALKATADGSPGTTIEARLKTGGSLSNTYLDLQGTDKLTAFFGSDSQPMARNSLLGEVWYTAQFNQVAENTLVRIDFERGHDPQTMACLGAGAPNSMVTLPAPFSITAPMGGASVSRKSGLTITWSPSGGMDPMSYTVTGDCVTPLTDQIAGDTGTVTISKITPLPSQETQSCVVNINIQRARNGTVDSAYGEGGAFGATQVRQISFNSTP
jgi:hypothetical protein